MHDASIPSRKEGYQAANAVYDTCKQGATFNLPGAKAAADELGKQFEGRGVPATKRARKAPKAGPEAA